MSTEERMAATAADIIQTGQQIRRRVEQDETALVAKNPQLAETLKGAHLHAGEAEALAGVVARGEGGELLLRLAREFLTVAQQQDAAARAAAGEPVDADLPELHHRHSAGKVTERREATSGDGQVFVASPELTADTPHFFPGGSVCGRPLPEGWYSIPWWRDIRVHVAGAAGAAAGMVLGGLAYEFYHEVLAGAPGMPDATTWAGGVVPESPEPESANLLSEALDWISL